MPLIFRFNLVILLCIVVQLLSHVWLCNPMDCSTLGFPVLHHLLELAQTHVHWVGNAIQPSHPLSAPSLTLNLSYNQGIFQRVGSLHQAAKELEHQSSVLPMNTQSWFHLGLTGLISLKSKGLSKVFSSTTIQKYQYFSAQPSLRSSAHICIWLLEKNIKLCHLASINVIAWLFFFFFGKFFYCLVPWSIICLKDP